MPGKKLEKMIIADDEEGILDIIKYCFEEMKGVEIKYCRTGEEVIREALNFKPDLVLLDYMMPGMDGAATLEAMRLIPALSKTPVIFITAKVQKEEIGSYTQMGVKDVIVKPFDPMKIVEIVNSCWEKIVQQEGIVA